jgi:DNA-binding beta-propeller fold protein YncE
MPARPLRLILAAVVIAGIGGWLAVSWWMARPRPTAFGWPAIVTTVAGDGVRGFADGAGAKGRFSDPFGIAIDAQGVLYVADAGDTNRIRRIGRDGRTTTLPGTFDTPSGLALDRAGNLYVSDTGANLIRRISRKGVVTTLAGDGTAGFRDGPARQAQFNGPVGVAVGKRGEVYVADTYNDRIRRITPDGRVETLAGGPAPGFADGKGTAAAFDTPCGLAIAPDGALLIADTGNDAIRRLGQDGAVTTLARAAPGDRAAGPRRPIGLAATHDGYLYIAAFNGGRILELSPRGELRMLNGHDAWAPENRSLRLVRPAGVAVDRRGALYVAEAGRYAIRKLSPRRPRDAAAPPATEVAPAPPALLRAATVPWPLRPQWAWHEVVGDMGEVRGAASGDSRDHLHAGLDVRADVAETVVAVADEKVESPVAADDLNGLSENLQIDQLTYIHMRVGRTPAGEPLDPTRLQLLHDPAGKLTAVRVKRGARFHVGDPLGTVNGMAHVHLELGARGGDANPMGLRFPGLADHFAPHIESVQLLDAAGRRLTEREAGRLIVPRGAGPVAIVVDAWDQVDGDAPRRRLGLYRAGYQILAADGTPVKGFERPLINIVFDRLPPARDAAKIAYAADSGETVHGARETRFLYVVTNRVSGGRAEPGGWRPADLAPGDYTLRILAADYAGNEATYGRDLSIRVR